MNVLALAQHGHDMPEEEEKRDDDGHNHQRVGQPVGEGVRFDVGPNNVAEHGDGDEGAEREELQNILTDTAVGCS